MGKDSCNIYNTWSSKYILKKQFLQISRQKPNKSIENWQRMWISNSQERNWIRKNSYSVTSKCELNTWSIFYCSLPLAKTKKSDITKSCHNVSEMAVSCIGFENRIWYTHSQDIVTASSKMQDIIRRPQQFHFCVYIQQISGICTQSCHAIEWVLQHCL